LSSGAFWAAGLALLVELGEFLDGSGSLGAGAWVALAVIAVVGCWEGGGG
jgi:hypothetical protein